MSEGLHTNDAIGAISRLMDIGVSPRILSGNMIGIIAQRLARKAGQPGAGVDDDVAGVRALVLLDQRFLGEAAQRVGVQIDQLLRGFRGAPALDVEAVAHIITRVGQLLLGEPSIGEIDLNPVMVYPRGEGALALDAQFVVQDVDGRAIVAAEALLGPVARVSPGAMVTHVLWPRRPARDPGLCRSRPFVPGAEVHWPACPGRHPPDPFRR